jgi:hypothetical protein
MRSVVTTRAGIVVADGGRARLPTGDAPETHRRSSAQGWTVPGA